MANYYEIQTYGEGNKKDFTFYLESVNSLTNRSSGLERGDRRKRRKDGKNIRPSKGSF